MYYAASHDCIGPSLRKEPSEWLNLLEVLTELAALIERGLTEADRIHGGRNHPRKAAAIGANILVCWLPLRLACGAPKWSRSAAFLNLC
jgi:hypothetical protein